MKNKNIVHKLLTGQEITKKEARTLGDNSKINDNLPFKYLIRKDKIIEGGNLVKFIQSTDFLIL